MRGEAALGAGRRAGACPGELRPCGRAPTPPHPPPSGRGLPRLPGPSSWAALAGKGRVMVWATPVSLPGFRVSGSQGGLLAAGRAELGPSCARGRVP